MAYWKLRVVLALVVAGLSALTGAYLDVGLEDGWSWN